MEPRNYRGYKGFIEMRKVGYIVVWDLNGMIARAKDKQALVARQIKLRKFKLISDDGTIQEYETPRGNRIKFNKVTMEFSQ